MQIETLTLFQIQAFAGKLEGFDEHRETLLQRILLERDSGDGILASNQIGYHSARGFHVGDEPEKMWLREKLIAFATTVLGPMINPAKRWKLEIIACWSNVAPAGAWQVMHHHFPSPWSGVLYVDAEHVSTAYSKGSRAPAGGKLEFLCPVPVAEVFGLSPNQRISPRDGFAVLFPGALQHAVHPHQSDRDRVSISFNLAIRQADEDASISS